MLNQFELSHREVLDKTHRSVKQISRQSEVGTSIEHLSIKIEPSLRENEHTDSFSSSSEDSFKRDKNDKKEIVQARLVPIEPSKATRQSFPRKTVSTITNKKPTTLSFDLKGHRKASYQPRKRVSSIFVDLLDFSEASAREKKYFGQLIKEIGKAEEIISKGKKFKPDEEGF